MSETQEAYLVVLITWFCMLLGMWAIFTSLPPLPPRNETI